MQTDSKTGTRCGPLLAALTLALSALPAAADFIPSGGGSYSGLPMYRAFVFGGIDTLAATSPGYLAQDILDGVDYVSNTARLPLATGGGTRSASGATLTGNGWSANSGFMASRNFASITVDNAQTTDDYYLVAGQGGTTRAHFEANAAAASATYTWKVSGQTSTAGGGRADARLDFASTTSPGSDWGQVLFGGGQATLSEFGPGLYSYTVPLTGQSQDVFLYWWTSAFTLLSHDTVAQGTDASMTADFGSTYELIGVQLFDDQGAELTDWLMTDLDTQLPVFDETGRLAPIDDTPALPEPASAALVSAALAGMLLSRRRRR